MFARCSTRASRNVAFRPTASTPTCCSGRVRHNSAVPERNRKLPNAPSAFRLKPVHQRILYGGIAVASLTGGWQLYDWLSKDRSFASYTLDSRDTVSPSLSIFHLTPETPSGRYEAYKDAWRRGIWNVQFKQPQLQIVRAYTPLPPFQEADGDPKQSLRFLIRRDPHGEVSSYLHRLPVGSTIEMRGPYLEYEITPEVRQVVFFAGGTGIAPAFQVAHALFEGRKADPPNGIPPKQRKLHILWASRRREDCEGGISDPPPEETLPPKPTWSGLFNKPKQRPQPVVTNEQGFIVKELEALKQRYPGQITVEYFVNTEDSWIDEDAVYRALSRFEHNHTAESPLSSAGQKQILISGPPGFIGHLAGEKVWGNGREQQGPLRGVLAQVMSRNSQNVKIWKI